MVRKALRDIQSPDASSVFRCLPLPSHPQNSHRLNICLHSYAVPACIAYPAVMYVHSLFLILLCTRKLGTEASEPVMWLPSL